MPESSTQIHLSAFDIGILLVYLGVVIAIGIRAGRGQKTEVDYLLGGRQMPWFMVVASVLATGFSGISLVGAPGYSFAHDCRLLVGVLIGLLTLPITLPVISYLRQQNFLTVYEFLERRFSLPMRTFASGMFLLTKFAYAGVVIYTPALLIATATGIPVLVMILIMGVFSTTLSLVGGLKGAVWTDLLQLAVMVVGMGGILFVLLSANWESGGSLVAAASAAGNTRMWDFSWDWAEVTFWAVLTSTILSGISATFADQVQMQYYLSTKPKDVVRTCIVSQLVGIPMVAMLYFLGVLLFGFYAEGGLPPEIRAKPDAVLPYFVSTQLPTGFRAVVIAAITAATVSTVVSILNSLSLASVEDFVERVKKVALTESRKMQLSRWMVAGWGAGATLLASFVSRIGTIIEATQTLAGIIGGGLAGIFFLGFFVPRAGSKQAMVGCVVGTLASLSTMLFSSVSFLWYFVVGMGVTVLVGWLTSLNRPRPKRSGWFDFSSAFTSPQPPPAETKP